MRTISSDMNMSSLRAIMDERPSGIPSSSIFVVIDGAAPSVSIKTLYEHGASLYPLIPTDYAVGEERFLLPYICEFDEQGIIFNFCKKQIGKGSFILVDSKSDLMETLSHLGKNIFVNTYKQEDKILFRYFDPHVFEAFSLCATPEQKDILFGSKIYCFWVEFLCDLLDQRNINNHGIENINIFQKITNREGQYQDSGDLFFTHEQVGEFKRQRTLYLSDRLELYVLSKYQYDENQLNATAPHIRQAVKIMKSYGIGSVACMEKYVSCCIEYGWDFLRERPDIMRTVSAPGLPDNYKERLLNDLLIREEPVHAI